VVRHGDGAGLRPDGVAVQLVCASVLDVCGQLGAIQKGHPLGCAECGKRIGISGYLMKDVWRSAFVCN